MSRIISPEEFAARFERLCEQYLIAQLLKNQVGGYSNFPAHLKKDALLKMGLKEVKDPWSDAVSYEAADEEVNCQPKKP